MTSNSAADEAVPQVSVNISPDKMRAVVSIVRESGSTVDKETVFRALGDAGVSSGINKELVAALLARSAEENVVEAAVAEGTPPQNGEDGSIEWQIDEPSVDTAVRVKKGGTIVTVKEPARGKSGSTVTGEELPSRAVTEVRLMKGRGVTFDRKRGAWTAELDGCVVFKDGRLSVEEYQDASFSVELDESGLAARITIVPFKGRGEPVTLEAVFEKTKGLGLERFDSHKLEEIIARAAGGSAVSAEVFAEQDRPEIETSISADAMEASIKLKMPASVIVEMTSESIRRFIEAALKPANIVHGIDSAALDRLAKDAVAKRSAEGIVARGTKAEDGKNAAIEWVVPDPTGDNPVIAKAGGAIAKIAPATAGSAAQTVTGLTIKPKAGQDARMMKGTAVIFDRKTATWSAEKEGRVIFKGDRLSVEPYENASFTLEISPDGMKALLTIVPAKKHGKKVAADQVKKEIQRLEILRFDETKLEELVKKAGEGTSITKEAIAESDAPRIQTKMGASAMEAELELTLPKNPIRKFTEADAARLIDEALAGAKITHGIDPAARGAIATSAIKTGVATGVIARGTPPTNGKDGSIEWLAGDPEKDLVLVEPGSPIAKSISPEAGCHGHTVTGVELKSKNGQEARLVKGKGIAIDKKTGVWSASEKGSLSFKSGNISVKPYADATFALEVDPGGHAARLSITPRQGDGKNVTPEAIGAELDKRKISRYDKDAISQAIERASTGAMVMHRVVAQCDAPSVAISISKDECEATATVAVSPATIAPPTEEYLFKTLLTHVKHAGITFGVDKERTMAFVRKIAAEGKASAPIAVGQAPENESDESISWKVDEPANDKTVMVKARTILAKVVPANPGKKGFTVTGKAIDPGSGRKVANVTAGKGVTYDAREKQWLAASDGRVKFDGKTITVET